MDQGLRYCVRLRGELLRRCTGRARPLERAGQGLRPRAGRTTAPPAALTGQGLRQSVQLRGEPFRRRAGRAQPLRQGWWRPSASIATHCCKVRSGSPISSSLQWCFEELRCAVAVGLELKENQSTGTGTRCRDDSSVLPSFPPIHSLAYITI
jgi:hypothetical protein